MICRAPRTFENWTGSFYRTSNGAELDLVLEKGRRRIAVEFKASTAPDLGRGFWNALDDVQPEKAWVVAPVEASYPIRGGVRVASVAGFLRESGVAE